MATSRRGILAAGGAAALVAAGYAAYRQAPPFFWRQLYNDMSRDIPAAPHQPDPASWPDSGLHAAWLGHATVLLKIDGFTILTDPIFSDRCGIDLWLGTIGPKRLVRPALTIPQLPKIDLVLLSHAHFDHWDLPSLRKIASKGVPVICAAKTSDLLNESHWKTVKELPWRETAQVGPLLIKAIEVKHWGARMRRDTYRGYNGYVIDSGKYRVLFSGDSAYTELFKEARQSRPIDLGIMPIGAYNPWIAYHCTPEQAIQMADWAGVERILPVHHRTFTLSTEPLLEPIERFLTKLGKDNERAVAFEVGAEWGT